MKLRQLRIDSRLIHGQVATFWTNFLDINRIIVVSDELVKDKLQVDMLRMSCPSSCKLTVCQVNTFIKNIENEKYEKDTILVISPNIDTTFDVFTKTVNKKLFPEVNVGNVPKRIGTFSIAKTVNITDEEQAKLIEIQNEGVDVFLQMIPTSQVVSLSEALKNSRKEPHDTK